MSFERTLAVAFDDNFKVVGHLHSPGGSEVGHKSCICLHYPVPRSLLRLKSHQRDEACATVLCIGVGRDMGAEGHRGPRMVVSKLPEGKKNSLH